MCFRKVELYRACRCLYYQYPVDRCNAYGRPGHGVHQWEVFVGYACSYHSTLKQARRTGPTGEVSVRSFRPGDTAELKPGDASPAPVHIEATAENASREDPKVVVVWDKRAAALGQRPFADFFALEERQSMDAPNKGSTDSNEKDPSIASTDTRPSWSEEEIALAQAIAYYELLRFGDLPHLWPQLRSCYGTHQEASAAVTQLISNYAAGLTALALQHGNELAKEAVKGQQEAAAAELILDWVELLADHVCRAHAIHINPRAGYPELSELPGWSEAGVLGKESGPFAFSGARGFLFESEPILLLESDVKELVVKTRPGSVLHSAVDFISIRIQNLLVSHVKPPPGSQRIHWTCDCGMNLYDDFQELKPGGLEGLAELLQHYNRNSQKTNQTSKPRNASSPLSWASKGASMVKSVFKPSRNTPLPRFQPPQNGDLDTEIGACSGHVYPPSDDHDYVLMCVPFMARGAKLQQEEVCRIRSDRYFFRMLRHLYTAQRPWKHWWIPKKVQAINFVQFEMYKSELVDILSTPSLPPDERTGTDYAYEPSPPATNPPIGPNLLMHLFEYPDHAEVLPVLYRKIPKKLRAKLAACPVKGSSEGWGIQLVEGLDRFVLAIYGCIGFAMALVLAVSWAVVRDDVQGGFAIAGFLLAFMAFCGSAMQSGV